MKPLECDLIIAGGGTTGLCLALALSRVTQLRIAVVEAQSFSAQQSHPGFDSRSVALAKRSIDLLKKFGVNQVTQLSCPIQTIQVTDKGHVGQCLLNAEDHNLDAVGRVIELFHLGQCLHKQINSLQTGRLTFLCPDSIQSLQQHQSHIDVTTSRGQQLRAKLLVVAEGAESPTRTLLKIDATRVPYHQVAIIANVTTSNAHNNQAFERFTQSGPLAMLPMLPEPNVEGQSRCSLVWTVNADEQQALMQQNEQRFLAILQSAFGYRLGKLTHVGERACYPLQLTQANASHCHRAVLVGNASQSLHPIAGQGLNLALRDIESLSGLITHFAETGKDIGGFLLTSEYQARRHNDKHSVIGLTDTLVRVFSNDYWPLVIGRNLGLGALNMLPAMKAQLARQAMGMKLSDEH